MRKNLLVILFLFVSLGLFAQETNLNKLMQERNEYYFTFNLNGNDNLQKIAQTISVDRVDGNVVTAYANNKQFAEFKKMGYEVTLQTPPSMMFEAEMWDGSNRAAYDWDQYPTYSAYESMMQQFATDHPDRCTYMELGTLNSGRKIMVCRINNGQTDGKPKFLYTSTMHGDEVTGMMLMLRLIDELCTSNDARIMNLVNNLDIFISPCTNPDGTYHGGNSSVNGATRYNGNGVDLNRHFPDFDDGPHPDGASHYENEAQWMMDLAQEYLFTMSANYHGGAEVMNYPWDTYQPICADDAWWQLVSLEYVALCRQVSSNYMTDTYSSGITNGYAWYTINGSRQDYMNYYAQCREVTIECSSVKTPSASQMPNFWNINHNSMLAYMEQCLNGIHGIVTDATTGAPVVATVTMVGHDHHGSTVTSHMPTGDYYRVIKGGTYNVKFTANGYEPYETTVTVADGQAVELNVQMTALEGIAADFSVDATTINIGGTAHFTDESWGAQINSWSWEFEGGTPATSTAQNPTVTYNEAGTYGVRLTVTNADGESDTKYVPNYISVVSAYNMQNGTVTTCDAMFYDDGGASANYTDSKDYTMTFMPATEGGLIEVTFQLFDTESGYDYMCIYDGTSASAPQIGGQYSGSNNPTTVTATNVQGALTFTFHSDYSVNKAGWAAHVVCLGMPVEVTAGAEYDTIYVGHTNTLFASATGGSYNYTYSWSPADNLNDATAQNPVFTATETGEFTYTVTVSDGTETATASVSFVVVEETGVDEILSDLVSVYPNPASSVINIKGLEGFGNLEVAIVSLQGQVVRTVNNALEIDVKDIASGIYFLNINCDGKQIIKRIVVE